MAPSHSWDSNLERLGSFIRSQRKLANLSLRELAARTSVSNPYLSQIERGLHEPSVRVLKSIATALNLSAETLLAEAGLLEGRPDDVGDRGTPRTETAIRADPRLSDDQKQALLGVYRSYVAANEGRPSRPDGDDLTTGAGTAADATSEAPS